MKAGRELEAVLDRIQRCITKDNILMPTIDTNIEWKDTDKRINAHTKVGTGREEYSLGAIYSHRRREKNIPCLD